MTGSPESPPQTIGELLRDGAWRAGDLVAVREPGRADVCYRELERDARRRASGLLARGLRPGDRVAAWLDDGQDYVELYLACALAGLIIVPCNRRYRAREVAAIIAACEPAILVHEPEAGDDLDVTAPGVPRLPRDGFGELAAEPLADGALPAVRPEDPFVLGYTSGTTGPPKGAVLTHKSVCAIARLNADSYRLPEHSVCAMTGSMSFVAVVPAHMFSHFHVRGMVRFLGPWTIGSLVDVLATEHVDFVYVPSPLIEEFAAAAGARPAALDGLGTVLHSGSKASVASLTLLAGCVGTRLVEGWGMTENSGGLITAVRPEDLADRAHWPTALSTVGRAATETEVDVVDESWRSLPHDGTTIGDLVFRSPAAMAGYWRDERATERALRDGWVRSGDLGTIDGRGYVRISDRRTDLIVSGGMNVYTPLRSRSASASCPASLP
jgi:fatty-acyl-CoA synthase